MRWRPGAARVSPPTRGLLGVVARLAQPLAVVAAGAAAGVVLLRVVGVADRRVAPRCAAGLVAEPHEAGKAPREQSAPSVHGEQLAGGGAGVEPTQPHPFVAGAGADHELAVGGASGRSSRLSARVAASSRSAAEDSTAPTRVSAIAWPLLVASPLAGRRRRRAVPPPAGRSRRPRASSSPRSAPGRGPRGRRRWRGRRGRGTRSLGRSAAGRGGGLASRQRELRGDAATAS